MAVAKSNKEAVLKNQAEVGLAVFFLASCLLWGCAGTRLCGKVYDANQEPVTGRKIEVKAEPGNRSTWIKDDGSFVLKGLKADRVYTIIATCGADEDRARVYIHKGKNALPEDQILQVACERISTPPAEDTLGQDEKTKGPVKPRPPG